MNLLKKKDKSVTVSEDGKKVKIKLSELEKHELYIVALECIAFYDFHARNPTVLNSINFDSRAALSFFMELNQKLKDAFPKLTLTRTEAYLFWGWVNQSNPISANQPGVMNLLGKLHQKLS